MNHKSKLDEIFDTYEKNVNRHLDEFAENVKRDLKEDYRKAGLISLKVMTISFVSWIVGFVIFYFIRNGF